MTVAGKTWCSLPLLSCPVPPAPGRAGPGPGCDKPSGESPSGGAQGAGLERQGGPACVLRSPPLVSGCALASQSFPHLLPWFPFPKALGAALGPDLQVRSFLPGEWSLPWSGPGTQRALRDHGRPACRGPHGRALAGAGLESGPPGSWAAARLRHWPRVTGVTW